MPHTSASKTPSWLRQIQGDLQAFLGLDQGLAFHPWVKPRLQSIVHLLGQTYFPPGGPIPYSGEDVDILGYLSRMIERIEPDQANGLCAAFLACEYVLPPLLGYKGRFSRLSPREREGFLRDLLDSSIYPFRMISNMFKIFFSMAYLADPRVLREIDFFKVYPYPADKREIHLRPDVFATPQRPSPHSSPAALETSQAPVSAASPPTFEEPQTTPSPHSSPVASELPATPVSAASPPTFEASQGPVSAALQEAPPETPIPLSLPIASTSSDKEAV